MVVDVGLLLPRLDINIPYYTRVEPQILDKRRRSSNVRVATGSVYYAMTGMPLLSRNFRLCRVRALQIFNRHHNLKDFTEQKNLGKEI